MNDVNPLLHIFLMDKRVVFGTEKAVKVKLAEFSLFGNLPNLVGQLIGKHHHLRQRKIGIPALAVVPSVLGTLLVGIGPVVNLFLDKLPAGDGTERSA